MSLVFGKELNMMPGSATSIDDGIHLFASVLLIFNRFGAEIDHSSAFLACLHSDEVFELRYL